MTAHEFVKRLHARLAYPPTGCWTWPVHGANAGSAPIVTFRGKTTTVARILWAVHYGVPPKGQLYRTCPDKLCVSPHHRREGGKYAPHPGPREQWPEEDRGWKASDVKQKDHAAIARKHATARKAEAFLRLGQYPYDES